MNKFALILAASSLVATSAQAGSKHGRYDYDEDDNRNTGSDYAEVVSARPIYQELRVSQPRQECWNERVAYRDQYRDQYRDGPSNFDTTAGAVIGGLIGGAAGHQFGGGSGRQIATAIGAVIGAQVGQNYVRNNGSRSNGYDPRGYDPRGYGERAGYEQRCRTVDEARYEQRITGYDVSYRYQGRLYSTQMPYDPGRRIPVQVSVSPLR